MLKNKLSLFSRNIRTDKKKRKILIFLLSPFVLAGIALLIFYSIKYYDSQIIDQSFLTGNSCKAPCWYGLVPGISTDKDIMQKLPQLSFIDAHSIVTNEGSFWPGSQPHMIYFNCKSIQKTQCGFLIVTDNRLKFINLYLQYNLELSQVIQKLGPPVYIDYYQDIINPPNPVFIAELSWPVNRIVTQSQINDTSQEKALLNGAKLPGKLTINEIYYVDSEYFGFDSPGERVPWPGIQ